MRRAGPKPRSVRVTAVLSGIAALAGVCPDAAALGPGLSVLTVPPFRHAVAPAPLPQALPPPIIRRVDNDEMRIAITFDACATQTQSNGFDRAVWDIVQREQVPTTIFVSGRWVEFHPDAMAELAANPLVEFANHSYAHPDMSRLSPEKMAAEIDRTEETLGRYGRHSVAFRPPFGFFDNRVLEVVRSRQLPAVLWDVVSGDPGKRATAPGIVRTVLRETRSGSIVIFHINARAPQTAQALPPILRELRARGFEFVRLSTLLSSANIEAPPAPVVPAMATPPAPVRPAPVSSPPPEPAPERPTVYEQDDAVLPPSGSDPDDPWQPPRARRGFVPASTPRQGRAAQVSSGPRAPQGAPAATNDQ